jgi:hypothetical protein
MQKYSNTNGKSYNRYLTIKTLSGNGKKKLQSTERKLHVLIAINNIELGYINLKCAMKKGIKRRIPSSW